MPASCYLCGCTGEMTKDHVPPKCFFPPEVREKVQLITVPACFNCNNGLSDVDEEMLRWITTSAFASQAGRWIFDNKVAKTLQANAKLAQRLMGNMRKLTVTTPEGTRQMDTLTVSTPVFERFIIRIAKGLLRKFHPQVDYTNATFLAENILPTVEGNLLLKEIISKMAGDSRGDDVFRFWHAYVIDHPDKGAFIFMFYEGAVFMVMYGNGIQRPPL